MADLSYPRDLPPVLAAIAEAAGEQAALKIARAHGGTRVTMPSRADGDNWLTRLVGQREAQAIIESMGSARRIDVPLGPEGGYSAARRLLAARIAELEAAGASATQMARALGITDRAIRMRKASARARRDSRQGELFD